MSLKPNSSAASGCAPNSGSVPTVRFFLANAGPASDPHKLGRDNDGLACENN